MKYRNHPSTIRIGEICHGSKATNFRFSTVQKTQILKDITQLNSLKAGQSTDILTKIITQNSDIFPDSIVTSFYGAIALKIPMWV